MFTTLLKLANSLVNIKINAQIREGVYCGFSVASKGNIIPLLLFPGKSHDFSRGEAFRLQVWHEA